MLLVILTLAVTVAHGCKVEPQRPLGSDTRTQGLQLMPDLDQTDLEGKLWSAPSFSNRTVLIEFWATWCGPCLEIAPDLHAFYKRHKKSATLLSLSLDEKADQVQSFVRANPFPNPVIHAGPSSVKTWEIAQIPALVLIRDGRIIAKWQGKDEVLEALKTLDKETKL